MCSVIALNPKKRTNPSFSPGDLSEIGTLFVSVSVHALPAARTPVKYMERLKRGTVGLSLLVLWCTAETVSGERIQSTYSKGKITMTSLSHRILFPVSDCLEADANNVTGIRRRLRERNVGAGDLLVVTNTYRSGDYVDHEGNPMDAFVFGRKFFINQDTLFTVEGIEDAGGRLVLSVSEYPSGVEHRIVLEDVVGYARARVSVVGVDGGYHFSSVEALVDGRFLVHVSRAEGGLVEQVCGLWDRLEGLVQTVNRCLPVVRGGLLPPHQDLRVSVVGGLEHVVGRDEGLVGRLEVPVVEAYDAVLGRMDFVLGKYRRYRVAAGKAVDANFGLPPVVRGGRTLVLAGGVVLGVGCFVGTRFDYCKRANRWLPATDPRYVFVSQIVSIDELGRSAVLALDTGDEAVLVLGEEDEAAVIRYDGREYQLLSPLTVARGVTFSEANDYVVSKYQEQSRREWLANLDGDRFVRELTSIGHPVPAELTEYLHQLRTVSDDVETACKKARKAVLKQKRAKVKEVATVEVPQWRELWNEYKTLHAELHEALSQH